MYFNHFYDASPFVSVSSIVTQSNMLLTPLVGARFLQTRSMPRKSTFRICCSHQWFWLCFELFINIMDLPTSWYFRICCYFQGQSTIFDNNNNAMEIASATLLLSPMVLAMFRTFHQHFIRFFTSFGRDAGTLEFVTFGAFLFSPFWSASLQTTKS